MITTVTGENYVKTHIVEMPPSNARKGYAVTRCKHLIHQQNAQTETVESEDEIRNACEECVSE